LILDRYLIRQFLSTLAFSLIALSVLFVIIDLFDNLDKFLDNNVKVETAVKYYVLFLPGVLRLIAPVATLLAALFSIGRLSTNLEIVSIRAGGRSLYRMLVPFVLVVTAISFGQLYFNGWVAPRAAWDLAQIKRGVLRQADGSSSMYNMYFRDVPLQNVSIEYYDELLKSARNVVIEQFSSVEHPRITKKIEAAVMDWNDSLRIWKAPLATIWTFDGDSVRMEHALNIQMPFSIAENRIVNLQRNPEELTLDELKEYIQTMKLGGKNSRKMEITYYAEWAFPFAHVIVMLIAVPFASVRRRGGMAVNIAAAMIIAFSFIAFNTISQAQGLNSSVDAAIVAWTSNGVFLIVAMVIIARTRT